MKRRPSSDECRHGINGSCPSCAFDYQQQLEADRERLIKTLGLVVDALTSARSALKFDMPLPAKIKRAVIRKADAALKRAWR